MRCYNTCIRKQHLGGKSMLDDIFCKTKSLFEPNVHTELRAQENRSRVVVLMQGNLVNNNRSETSGTSARVFTMESMDFHLQQNVLKVLQS